MNLKEKVLIKGNTHPWLFVNHKKLGGQEEYFVKIIKILSPSGNISLNS